MCSPCAPACQHCYPGYVLAAASRPAAGEPGGGVGPQVLGGMMPAGSRVAATGVKGRKAGPSPGRGGVILEPLPAHPVPALPGAPAPGPPLLRHSLSLGSSASRHQQLQAGAQAAGPSGDPGGLLNRALSTGRPHAQATGAPHSMPLDVANASPVNNARSSSPLQQLISRPLMSGPQLLLPAHSHPQPVPGGLHQHQQRQPHSILLSTSTLQQPPQRQVLVGSAGAGTSKLEGHFHYSVAPGVPGMSPGRYSAPAVLALTGTPPQHQPLNHATGSHSSSIHPAVSQQRAGPQRLPRPGSGDQQLGAETSTTRLPQLPLMASGTSLAHQQLAPRQVDKQAGRGPHLDGQGDMLHVRLPNIRKQGPGQ
jgi:hypothetical protein